MKRRAFIAGLGGAATWPLVGRGQQPERIRLVGVLLGLREADSVAKAGLAAFQKALLQLGWASGRNLSISVRYADADLELTRAYAAELVDMTPDIILALNTPTTAAVLAQTRAIPIVFISVHDPVGSGLIESLAHPGGNVTGFTNFEASIGGKWVEVLKDIAPSVKRAAIMFNPEAAPFAQYFVLPFEAAARSLAVEPSASPVRDDGDIERVVADLARDSNGGLVVLLDAFTYEHRAVINRLTVRYRVPAVNSTKAMTEEGGLVAYAADGVDLFRRSATYVDRILKGDKPGELPVQQPTKFEFVINLKTAKMLGLDIPPTLLARADEVIE